MYRDINKVNVRLGGGVLVAENVTEWGTVKAMLIPVTDDPEETECYNLVASMVARKHGLS